MWEFLMSNIYTFTTGIYIVMFTILMPSREFCIVIVRQAKVVGVCVYY